MVGHFIDTVVGNVANWDSSSFRGIKIDIIHTDPVPDDNLSVFHTVNHFGVNGRELSDDRIRVSN